MSSQVWEDDRLICPACGERCETILPLEPFGTGLFGAFEDGCEATCQCGARVMVDVDEGVAELKEVEE